MFDFIKKKSPSTTSGAKTKKSKGYYLELDEAQSLGTPPEPKPLSPEASIPASPEVASSEVITPETPTTTAKAAKVETPPTTVAPAPQPTPEPKPVVVTSVPEPDVLPVYLQPSNTPRRRPGPSLAKFKAIAQELENR